MNWTDIQQLSWTDTQMVLFALGVLIVLTGAILIHVLCLKASSKDKFGDLLSRLEGIDKEQERIERSVKEELIQNRSELANSNREQRQELLDSFRNLGLTLGSQLAEFAVRQKVQLDGFSGQLASFANASCERLDLARSESATASKQLREEVMTTLGHLSSTINQKVAEFVSLQKSHNETLTEQLAALTQTNAEKLDLVRIQSGTSAQQLREEVHSSLKGFGEFTTQTLRELGNLQKSQLESMSTTIGKLADGNERKLEEVRKTVEGKLQNMQNDNARQLEQMRQTVDEKLQGTLEKRLGESFKLVSERLELVHKGLGEMHSLATGVGDLKKVLTNVKTRGTWGEIQLGNLLEQVLSPDQFATNIATKEGGERVEFAISLPGQHDDREEVVWLPIDAKFPVEDYHRLIEAQEKGNADGAEAAGRQLEGRVKGCAAEICRKYLNPPKTTDFAVLFLPIEGLFAEVIRRTGLTEFVQREYRVVIAGPTTLWSILNSLQMGFRTLAIQKRSSEVWNLLAAVKTEWTRYGEVLDAVRKKINQASETIEKAQVRTRAIGRKLRGVQELSQSEARSILLVEDFTEEDKESGSVNVNNFLGP